MILDKFNVFDFAAALTTARVSGDVVDLVNNRDINAANHVELIVRVQVPSALLSAGATTLSVDVQGSTDGTTWDIYATSPVIPKANLATGAFWDIAMPGPTLGQGMPKQLRLNYNIATGPFTGGTISGFIVLDAQRSRAYPAGVIVSN